MEGKAEIVEWPKRIEKDRIEGETSKGGNVQSVKCK